MRFNMIRAEGMTGSRVKCDRDVVNRADWDASILKHVRGYSLRKFIASCCQALRIRARQRSLDNDLIRAALVRFIMFVQIQVFWECDSG